MTFLRYACMRAIRIECYVYVLAEEEKKCVDATGRLLFRKPKDKPDESDAPASKSEIVEVASSKATKRKPPTSDAVSEKKKAKAQLLSFMDEGGRRAQLSDGRRAHVDFALC